MADGVLLDWEGVLADTAESRRAALRAAHYAQGVAVDAAPFERVGLPPHLR